MPTTINASNTSGGAVVTGDGSGILELQSGGVTALTANGANVTVAGTLTATGGIPAVTTALTSPVSVIGNATAGAEIRLPEDTDNGSNYVALKAANALAANLTFTLPDADGTSGQLLQTNGSGTLSFATPASGSLLRTTVFTASGTWTKGAGTNFIKIYGVGGGGAGGGCRASVTSVAGGGGGGGYFQEQINTAAVSTATVTIGAGGTGVSEAAGNAGGTTSFNTYASGNGGGGGAREGGAATGGAGGTATGGDVNITGQTGSNGADVGNVPAGLGGSSLLGLGGGMLNSSGASTGRAATGYGGGGGGSSNSGGAVKTGGAGTSGIIIVEEYT